MRHAPTPTATPLQQKNLATLNVETTPIWSLGHTLTCCASHRLSVVVKPLNFKVCACVGEREVPFRDAILISRLVPG